MKRALTLISLAVAALLPAAAGARPVLSILPAVQTASVGDTVVVEIYLSGYKAINEIVSAFDLNVLYDATLLSTSGSIIFNAVPAMGGIALAPFSSSFNPGDRGAIVNSLISDDDALAALQTDDPFKLLTFTFAATGNGAAFLNFGPDPDFQRAVVGRRGLLLDLDYRGACVAIGADANCQAVPEPASYGLAGLALLLAAGATRRRHGAAAHSHYSPA